MLAGKQRDDPEILDLITEGYRNVAFQQILMDVRYVMIKRTR